MKLKALSLLIAFSMSSPTLAIGLGELTVRSHLGQPLHVTIEIIDPPATLDAACLSLAPAPNGLALPTRTRFAVERNDARTLLHITTRERFAEPAAQFVLTSDCDGRLQREYVFLLDPPLLPEMPDETIPEVVTVKPEVEPSVARGIQAPAPKTVADAGADIPRLRSSPAKPQPRPAAKLPPRPAPKPAAEADAPRLIISGKPRPATGPDGEAAANGHALTIAELSDENTALLHKLAHIESQLLALNQRNAELEARLNTALLPVPPPASMPVSNWLVTALGFLGLLAGSGALLAWWRRHDRAQDRHTTFPDWTTPPVGVTAAHHAVTRPAARAVSRQDLDEFPLTAASAGTEVREDAVDQAEVLAVHGYAGLAIQLLREHLRRVPAESPTPWLLLLDLLHREHDDQGYAEASAEFRRHFNVNFPERPTDAPADDQQGLLAYPHILDMLTQAWNTPALEGIFQNLIFDKRSGMRLGFEPGAYQDILLLRDIAHTMMPAGR